MLRRKSPVAMQRAFEKDKTTTRRNQVALYVSSSKINSELLKALLNIFNSSQDYPEIPPRPDYICHLPEADIWSLNAGYEQIYKKHRTEYYPAFYAKPIVIADERTSEDKTIVMVSPELQDSGEFVTRWFRIVPERVVGAAANLQISNQDINDVSLSFHFHLCSFRVELLMSRSRPTGDPKRSCGCLTVADCLFGLC